MNCSVMNVVCYERGLLWTWSVMNVVCYERGLLWTWSILNVVCYDLVCYELVCYKCGLIWTGLLWTWSVMNVVCYERVCYERGLLWMGLLWTSLLWAVCYEHVCFERTPAHLTPYCFLIHNDLYDVIQCECFKNCILVSSFQLLHFIYSWWWFTHKPKCWIKLCFR